MALAISFVLIKQVAFSVGSWQWGHEIFSGRKDASLHAFLDTVVQDDPEVSAGLTDKLDLWIGDQELPEDQTGPPPPPPPPGLNSSLKAISADLPQTSPQETSGCKHIKHVPCIS